MSENFIKHVICICGTLVAFIAWWSGYVSGGRGWWWTAIGLAVIYFVIFKLLDV
jgi:hypothetical protein